MSEWTWRPCQPSDRYCIAPVSPTGAPLPYTVAKVVIGGRAIYEAWHKGTASVCLSRHDNPTEARRACGDHWRLHNE